MSWKRIGRAALCLLVVCCLIFNYVSTPAKAIVIADDIALGITALLLLAAAGMVIVPQSTYQINDIGESFRLSLFQWGTSAEKLDEVEEFVTAFSLYDPSGDDGDDDESPNETKVKLARGILAGIAAWIASTIMAGRVETEGEAAPDGYAFYNGVLLGDVSALDSNGLSYITILRNPFESYYFLIFTSAPLIAKYDSESDTSVSLAFSSVCDSISYKASVSDGLWYDKAVGSYHPGAAWSESTSVIYTNYDVVCSIGSLVWADDHWVWNGRDSGTFFVGSESTSSEKIPVLPSIYFGDLPQKIQNGEADADDIVVPPEINYDILTQNGMPLAQSVVNTMNELATGKIDYDDYLDYIAPVPAPDPEPEPEPEPDPEPVVDPLADVSLQRFLEALGNALMDPLRWLANALLDGIRAMFVPSEDFITDKVNALRDKFAFADSIIETGQAIGTALSVGDSGPPVIYMHLQDAESDINWGGTVPALDMRWYERYKPTVDSLLSAMLWIFFAWRVFRKLPGIISGMEGDAPFEPVSDGRLGHYVSNLPRIGATSMRRRD